MYWEKENEYPHGLPLYQIKIIDTIDYFNYLNDKLVEIEENIPIFGNYEDFDIQERLIKRQFQTLRIKNRINVLYD